MNGDLPFPNDYLLLPSDFITVLNCDRSSSDAYPVSNLLSSTKSISAAPSIYCKPDISFSSSASNPESSQFMATSFVRPPVIVTWHFRIPITLRCIHLGLRVGSQRSTGVQIFVSDTSEGPNIQRRVGEAYFSSTESPEQCIFVDRNSIRNVKTSLDECKESKIIYFTKCHLLEKLKILAIKIVKASYVPCLGFAKIYVKSDETILRQVNSENWRRKQGTPATNANEKELTPAGKSTGVVNIPDDFIDPLTNSCMSLPVLLPCGQNIDRSSLEKYTEEEAKFGRPPSDPFTGVRFTDSSFPVPNAGLKERIDRFFLLNPDLAKELNIGRTLCSGGEYDVMRSSRKRKRENGSTPGNVNLVDGTRGNTDEKKMDVFEGDSSNSDIDGRYVNNLLKDLPSFL